MSYLLRALKKSESERAAAVRIGGATVAYLPRAAPAPPKKSWAVPTLLVLNGILLCLIVVSAPFLYTYWTNGVGKSGEGASASRTAETADDSTIQANLATMSDRDAPVNDSGADRPPPRVLDDAAFASLPESVRRKTGRDGGFPVGRIWQPEAKVVGGELPEAVLFRPPHARLALSPLSGRAKGPAFPAPAVNASLSARPVTEEGRASSPNSAAPSSLAAPSLPQVESGASRSTPSAPVEDLTTLRAQVAREGGAVDAAVLVPRVEQLPLSILNELPELVISVHAYDPNPQRRFVRLNRVNYQEGDRVGEDLWLTSITQEGVVLRYRDSEFTMGAN